MSMGLLQCMDVCTYVCVCACVCCVLTTVGGNTAPNVIRALFLCRCLFVRVSVSLFNPWLYHRHCNSSIDTFSFIFFFPIAKQHLFLCLMFPMPINIGQCQSTVTLIQFTLLPPCLDTEIFEI